MSKAVFCIVPSESQAQSIVKTLVAEGFHSNDISVLLPDKSGTRDFAHEMHTKAPEGALAGVGAGGAIGAAAGWLAGVGALAIPGLGPFLLAGPLLAALSGAAIGAGVGGLVGALVGMGIPEVEAKAYEAKVRSGNILIAAHAVNDEFVDRAKQVFTAAGASDIKVGSESTPRKTERV